MVGINGAGSPLKSATHLQRLIKVSGGSVVCRSREDRKVIVVERESRREERLRRLKRDYQPRRGTTTRPTISVGLSAKENRKKAELLENNSVSRRRSHGSND